MAESIKSPEVNYSPREIITNAFTNWLDAEIANSLIDNNAVLNDYEGFAKHQNLSADHIDNRGARKSFDHYNRLNNWTNKLFAHEDSDEAMALQLFGVLMGLSGAFREHCFVLANNQDSYMAYRYGSNDLGVSIDQTVTDRLHGLLGGVLPASEDLNQIHVDKTELVKSTLAVNELRSETTKKLYRGKPLLGMQRAMQAHRQGELRRRWLDIGVDYMVYAAQRHDGDLQQVALLEPKSITFAKLVRPLGGEPPYFVADTDKV